MLVSIHISVETEMKFPPFLRTCSTAKVSIHISVETEMKFASVFGAPDAWSFNPHLCRNRDEIYFLHGFIEFHRSFNPHLCRNRDEISRSASDCGFDHVSIHISVETEMKYFLISFSCLRTSFNPHLCRNRDEIRKSRGPKPKSSRFNPHLCRNRDEIVSKLSLD